ncbi:MAG: tannase/feruloyl esterase family alpha/beta hydrolase [Pseudolabrys sp.]
MNTDVESRRKVRCVLNTFLLSSVALYAGSAAAVTCASLTGLSLPNTTITLAQSYNAGDTVSGTTVAPAGLCRVAGTVKPSSDSNINFEVWIPTDGSWNGKYEQLGNGGYAGAISLSGIANQVSRGYAAAATDDGTSGPPRGAATFLGHPDVQIDFGYRAIKVTTDDSKAIVAALMGASPQYSYFNGCSDGGREALMEAQRYPDDFDGIIAGSPANDWAGLLGGSFLWDMQALLNGPQTNGVPDGYIPPAKLGLLTTAALTQCAGKDGGVATDAFLSDPRGCHFDPKVVQCKQGQDPTTCLTPAQVAAASAIYEGAHEKGKLLFPGYEPGGEAVAADWPTWLVGTSSTSLGAQNSFAMGFWCDQVLGNASCDYLGIDLQKQFEAAANAVAPIVSSIDTNLKPFKRHGGKLIQYAGWADTAIAPENGLNYYRKVAKEMGDVHNFYRVFMVPGMAHCSGGNGPNAFGNGSSNGPVIDADHDLVKALERWVEQGVAPDKIIATHYVNNVAAQGVQFQRPLCPYPQRGTYLGTGDPNLASSFKCIERHDNSDPRNKGKQAAYK